MEFKEYKLEEISLNITDGAHNTIKNDINGKYYLLSCKNIKNGKVNITNKDRKINIETLNRLRNRTKLSRGDILITTVGTVGEMAIVKDYEINYDFQRSVGIIKPNPKIIDPFFLYYSLLNEILQIKNFIKGAVQKCLFIGEMKKIVIKLPSLEIQNKVVKILSDIDKKIELNNKINDNLQQLSQELYKRWFIDFKFSNEEGKPYKSSGGEMTECELGEIPINFTLSNIGKFTKCVLGGTPSREKDEYWNGKIPWINSSKINEFRIIEPVEYITKQGLVKSSTSILPKKTTVIAITGTTLGQVSLLEIESCANQSVIGILEKEEKAVNYIYLLIQNNILKIISSKTGGAQQHINKSNIENFKIVLPYKAILKKFEKLIDPMFKKISNNCFENRSLINLKNTLLSKLLNGEIDLEKIEV